MYEQLFLMYVIPSVMVQSYICYVTKPIDELSKLSSFSSCLWTMVGKVIISFDSSNAACLKDGNSDPEPVSAPGLVSSHKASGDLASKTSSLKVMDYQVG